MNPSPPVKEIGLGAALLCAAGAVVSFSLAYAFTGCEFLILVFLACLFPLARLRTRRLAYYFGLGIGLAVYTPHLLFFWTTFGGGAVALWYVLPFWLGLFLMLGRACLFRFGPVAWACLAPFLWTGLEFFRSELYYLRFSWLNAGYVFSDSGALHYLSACGVYGIGFLFMAAAGALHLRGRARLMGVALLTAAALYPAWIPAPRSWPQKILRVAGVQKEFPGSPSLIAALNGAAAKFPGADVLVLSEYTLTGPVPDWIKAWCRKHGKYLVVGGEDPVPPADFYNTAFVVDTNGDLVFRQAKSVPVQFFKDGLPARSQQLWESPWGKIGLAICYDDSYSRVTDELIRQGAQALILPTMDSADWGEAQHRLHGRVAPMRAAEYAVPVFRVCSSGVSQFIDGTGRVLSSAPFPGDGAMLAADIPLPEHGRMPPDRGLARLSVAVAAALTGWLAVESIRQRIRNRARPSTP
ncbi:MAG: nitrilase-related carbon-nitrogen hydrolase [Verrucomicrobiota bacterium]|jgi:apolipoprotein N-acyltransferase